MYGRFFDLPWDEAARRADELLEFVQLHERAKDKVDQLSGGMKRRLSVARALINQPDLLLLDEPTTGLDPQARHLVWDRLYRLKQRGATIVLTTHYMDEAEHCDRIAIIDNGEIVVIDTPEALKASVGRDRVQLETDDNERAIEELRERFGLEASISEGAVTVHVTEGETFVPRLFADLDVPIRSVSVARPTLDDVFMSYTGTTIRDAEESAVKMSNRVTMQMFAGGRR
jgi:ABC-2 type transport system ATP-binding protein